MNDNSKVSRLSGGLQPLKEGTGNSRSDNPGDKDSIRERYNRQVDMSKVTVLPARPEPSPFDPRFRKRVVVYCRVSTDGISQTTSFELQKSYYLRYVRKRPDWKLVAMYSDEGITATSTKKRNGLLAMLNDAKAGKFDIIVVKNLSRLSRNLMDCMDIIYKLRKLPRPVGILFESENLFTLDKNVDFTLQILSLVAQEESHKKSEAMNASYKARNSSGQYTKPDLLGYDSIGINEIGVNVEEAKTVQLMFMMYLAGIGLDTIAEVLTMLGRKTHTHKFKNGKIKEGTVHWTASSVKAILQNERRCGDVLAPKSYTPNYLDHQSKKIEANEQVQYYAVDQHVAIVSPEDFHLTQRILNANKGGWKGTLPEMNLLTSGRLGGFVRTAPNWLGFSSEDYNRACLRASGFTEEDLNEIEERIHKQEESAEKVVESAEDFQYEYAIDSDDYEQFPEKTDDQTDGDGEAYIESYMDWVKTEQNRFVREAIRNEIRMNTYDLSDCELVRPQLFSLTEKPYVTLDRNGMSFSKRCLYKLSKYEKEIKLVDIYYNAVKKMVVVKKSSEQKGVSLEWTKEYDEVVLMKRCPCKGITRAIFSNMEWDEDFKYKIVGAVSHTDGETILSFYLGDPIIVAPIHKAKNEKNEDSRKKVKAKQGIRDGYDADEDFVVEIDSSMDISPIQNAGESEEDKSSRSRAIYYDLNNEQKLDSISVEEMKDKLYSPKFIQLLLQKEISPVEGWGYLKGMGKIYASSFVIFPADWADSFGHNCIEIAETKLYMHEAKKEPVKSINYGWTVGLDLPTLQTVKEAIETLKKETA